MGNAKTKEERKKQVCNQEVFCARKVWNFLTLGNPGNREVVLYETDSGEPWWYLIRVNNTQFRICQRLINVHAVLNVKWITNAKFKLSGLLSDDAWIEMIVDLDGLTEEGKRRWGARVPVYIGLKEDTDLLHYVSLTVPLSHCARSTCVCTTV